MWIVLLKPRGRFVAGLHSDTLFGCLAWSARVLFDSSVVRRWLAAFADGDPPFLLSSAFPYRATDGETVYFLPRPRHWPPTAEPHTLAGYREYKKYKKRQWLCRRTFGRLLQGERVEEAGLDPPEIRVEPMLHNRINRITWGTTEPGRLYYQELAAAQQEAGLYFLIDLRHQEEAEALRAAIALLSHLGWGGDSSRGVNQFDAEILPAPGDFFPPIDESTHFVTLSLYFPKAREREHFAARPESCWYELLWRRGTVGGRFYPSGHFWKRAVNYFAEGSVLPWEGLDRQMLGENPPVKRVSEDGKEWVVQSYGIAFPVPMKIAGVDA